MAILLTLDDITFGIALAAIFLLVKSLPVLAVKITMVHFSFKTMNAVYKGQMDLSNNIILRRYKNSISAITSSKSKKTVFEELLNELIRIKPLFTEAFISFFLISVLLLLGSFEPSIIIYIAAILISFVGITIILGLVQDKIMKELDPLINVTVENCDFV